MKNQNLNGKIESHQEEGRDVNVRTVGNSSNMGLSVPQSVSALPVSPPNPQSSNFSMNIAAIHTTSLSQEPIDELAEQDNIAAKQFKINIKEGQNSQESNYSQDPEHRSRESDSEMDQSVFVDAAFEDQRKLIEGCVTTSESANNNSRFNYVQRDTNIEIQTDGQVLNLDELVKVDSLRGEYLDFRSNHNQNAPMVVFSHKETNERIREIQEQKKQRELQAGYDTSKAATHDFFSERQRKQFGLRSPKSPDNLTCQSKGKLMKMINMRRPRSAHPIGVLENAPPFQYKSHRNSSLSIQKDKSFQDSLTLAIYQNPMPLTTTSVMQEAQRAQHLLNLARPSPPAPNSPHGGLPNTTHIPLTARSLAEQLLFDHYQVVSDEAMIRRLYADLKQKDLAEASAIVDLQILPRSNQKKELHKIYRRYGSVKDDKIAVRGDLDSDRGQGVASQNFDGKDSLVEAIVVAKRKAKEYQSKKRKGRKKSDEKNRLSPSKQNHDKSKWPSQNQRTSSAANWDHSSKMRKQRSIQSQLTSFPNIVTPQTDEAQHDKISQERRIAEFETKRRQILEAQEAVRQRYMRQQHITQLRKQIKLQEEKNKVREENLYKLEGLINLIESQQLIKQEYNDQNKQNALNPQLWNQEIQKSSHQALKEFINVDNAYLVVQYIKQKLGNARLDSNNLLSMYESQIHQDTDQENQKWEQVVSFMEKNPQVLMELLPMTPPSKGASQQQAFFGNGPRQAQVSQSIEQTLKEQNLNVPRMTKIRNQVQKQNQTDQVNRSKKTGQPLSKLTSRGEKMLQRSYNATLSSFRRKQSEEVLQKNFGLQKVEAQKQEYGDDQYNQAQPSLAPPSQSRLKNSKNNQNEGISDYVTAPPPSSTHIGYQDQSQGINLVTKRSFVRLDPNKLSSENHSIAQLSESINPYKTRHKLQKVRPNTAIESINRMKNIRPSTAVRLPPRQQMASKRYYLPSKSSNAGDNSFVGSEQNVMAARMRTNKIYGSQRDLRAMGQKQPRLHTAKTRLPTRPPSKLSNYLATNRNDSELEGEQVFGGTGRKSAFQQEKKQQMTAQKFVQDVIYTQAQSVRKMPEFVFKRPKLSDQALQQWPAVSMQGSQNLLANQLVNSPEPGERRSQTKIPLAGGQLHEKIERILEEDRVKRANQFDRLSKQKYKSNHVTRLVSFNQERQNSRNERTAFSIRKGSQETVQKSRSRTRSQKDSKRTEKHQRRLMKLQQMRKEIKKSRKRENERSETASDNRNAPGARRSRSQGRKVAKKKSEVNVGERDAAQDKQQEPSDSREAKSPTDILIKDLAMNQVQQVEKVQQKSLSSSLSYELSKRSLQLEQNSRTQSKVNREMTQGSLKEKTEQEIVFTEADKKSSKKSSKKQDELKKSSSDIGLEKLSVASSKHMKKMSTTSFKSKRLPPPRYGTKDLAKMSTKNLKAKEPTPPLSHRCMSCSNLPNKSELASQSGCKRSMSHVGDKRRFLKRPPGLLSPTNKSSSKNMSPGFNIKSPTHAGTPVNLDLEHLKEPHEQKKCSKAPDQNAQDNSKMSARSKKRQQQQQQVQSLPEQDRTLIVDNDAVEAKIDVETQELIDARMDSALEIDLPRRKRKFHEELVRQAQQYDVDYYDKIYDLRHMRLQLKREQPSQSYASSVNHTPSKNHFDFSFKKQSSQLRMPKQQKVESTPYDDGQLVSGDRSRLERREQPEQEEAETARIRDSQHNSAIVEKIEVMEKNKIPMAAIIGQQGYKYDGKINIIETRPQESRGPFDWETTDLYKLCLKDIPRFKRPKLHDKRAIQVQAYLDMLQAAPESYSTAQSVTPMFHFALTFLHDLLLHDLNLPLLYDKIKRVYTAQLSVESTIGILKRARIAQQLKDDAKQILCLYLDICTNESMIEQLRGENVSDGLLQSQIKKLQKDCQLYFKRSRRFVSDFKKTFKEGKIVVGGRDTNEHIKEILQRLDDLQKAYREEELENMNSDSYSN